MQGEGKRRSHRRPLARVPLFQNEALDPSAKPTGQQSANWRRIESPGLAQPALEGNPLSAELLRGRRPSGQWEARRGRS